MKKKKAAGKSRAWWVWTKRILLGLFLFQLFYIVILKWVYPPVTLTQLSAFFSGDGLKRDYVSGDELSYNIKLAVISSEDQIFPDHSGFDWKSIDKARKHNEKKNLVAFAAPPPSASKRLRTFFYGRAAAGSAKGWNCILPK